MLPIVQREMAVAARRKTTYAFRAVAGLIGFLIVFGTWIDLQGSSSNPSGQYFFWSVAVVGCVAASWQGTIRAARCLSEERASGTLGLLFLTPLKTIDVVLGKFTAAALLALQTSLTLAPILAVTALFGGVSIGEVARMSLWVANVAFFFIAASMLASALTASELAATAVSILFAGTVTFFGFHDIKGNFIFTDQKAFFINPVSAGLGIADSNYDSLPHFYWSGMVSGHLAGWAMLCLTAFALKRNWHRPEVFPILKFLWTRKPKPLKRGGVCKLGQNGPIEWLMLRDVYPWAPMIIVLICLAASVPFGDFAIKLVMGVVASLILIVGVIIHSAVAVARAKKGGMLELLAVAPIADEEIVDAQIRGLKRLFFRPAVVTAAWFIIFLPWREIWNDVELIPLYYLACIPLTMWAGAYYGIWMALKSKGPVMAITRNVVVIGVLPWVLPVPAMLYLFVVAMIAQQTVRTEFRALLAKRSQPVPPFPEIQRDCADVAWGKPIATSGN